MARSEYQRLCTEHHVKPMKAILQQLPPPQDGGEPQCLKVDLSGVNLSFKACTVLGKLLQQDKCIRSLLLSDCYTTEEGCQALCSGITHNTTLRSLNMKGNNLRRKAASALATVLKRNHCIQSFSLEWNSLGTDEDAFAMLMEGLAVNTSILHLDLRNNHITHLGARQLALALVQNRTVQQIDLSWNNCGLVGGRALLDCLQQNRSLSGLQLTGNTVADDVEAAISLALQRNVDRQQLESTYSSRTQHLTTALDNQMVTKKKEISSMIDKLESQRSAFDAALVASQERIVDLQRELMLGAEEIAQLQARHTTTETSLRVSEDQCHQYQTIVEQLRHEITDEHAAHEEAVKAEKEKYRSLQDEAAAAATQATSTADKLAARVTDLERTRRQLTAEIDGLQEDKKQLQLHVQKTENSFQSQRLSQEQHHTAALQEHQHQSQEELSRSRHLSVSREHAVQEQLRQSEMKCTQTEQELSRLKSSNLSAREALLADHKAQLEQVKNEHKLGIRLSEERMQQLQVEMDAKQSQVIQATSTANQLQSKLTALTQESAAEQQSVHKQVKKLEQLADEQSKVADAQRREKKEAQKQAQESLEHCHQLEQQLIRQKTKLADAETQHIGRLSAKDREVAVLSGRTDVLNQQLQQQREAELKRAGQLEAALAAFVSSTKSANA